MRSFSSVDMVRFARFCKENPDMKMIDAFSKYKKDYPEKTAKEQLENLLEAIEHNFPKRK